MKDSRKGKEGWWDEIPLEASQQLCFVMRLGLYIPGILLLFEMPLKLIRVLIKQESFLACTIFYSNTNISFIVYFSTVQD